MKKKVWSILLSFGIGLLTTSFQNRNYPTIVLFVHIYDKDTKQIVVGANCSVELTYQTQKCLPCLVKPVAPYSRTMSFQMLPEKMTIVLRHYAKSYQATVQHPDYQLWSVSDSTDRCQNIHLEVGLERKK